MIEPLPSDAKVWRCFHCDEVFTTEVDARNHFGRDEGSTAACVIKAPGEFALLQALRNAEDELARYRSEDSDVLRAMWSMTSDHAVALRREEEKGYARALRDTNYKESPDETNADPFATVRQGLKAILLNPTDPPTIEDRSLASQMWHMLPTEKASVVHIDRSGIWDEKDIGDEKDIDPLEPSEKAGGDQL